MDGQDWGTGLIPRPSLQHLERGSLPSPRPSPPGRGRVRLPPYGPPARRGDGRNMLRPYGLTRTYPSQLSPAGRGSGRSLPLVGVC